MNIEKALNMLKKDGYDPKLFRKGTNTNCEANTNYETNINVNWHGVCGACGACGACGGGR